MFDLTFTFSFLLIKKTLSIILSNGISLNRWKMKELYQMILHFIPGITHCTISSLTLLQIQRNLQRSWNYQTADNTYWRKAQGTFVLYLPLSYLQKPPLCRLSAIRYIVALSSS